VSNRLSIALHESLAPMVVGRVYPDVLPDDPRYPCFRYLVSTAFVNTLCGQSELSRVRYSVHVFAATVADAILLASRVQAAMRGFEFRNVPVGWADGYEPTVRKFYQAIEFEVWEREAGSAHHH
jgi:hypothetical protein